METQKLTLTNEQWNVMALIARGDYTEKIVNGKITLELSRRDFETLKGIFAGGVE